MHPNGDPCPARSNRYTSSRASLYRDTEPRVPAWARSVDERWAPRTMAQNDTYGNAMKYSAIAVVVLGLLLALASVLGGL